MIVEEREDSKPKRRRFGCAAIWAGVGLLFTAFAYGWSNDALAAFTIFPAWTWIVLAIAPFLVRARHYPYRTRLVFGLSAIGLLLLTTEEWRSLIRVPGQSESRTVRVVVLNCASLTEAAKEVIPLRPDVVLFSENPGRPACEAIARTLYGKEGRAVVGPDGAILSRAPLTKIEVPRGAHNFTAATTTLGGRRVGLIALRLQPPRFNIALFDPVAWQELAENRRSRRQEIAELAAWVKDHPEIELMAGDYNAQPWDSSLAAMPPEFTDAFRTAGTGWGHTAVNDYPLARIDQIWTRRWKPVRVWSQKTVHSDHRMVIGEFVVSR